MAFTIDELGKESDLTSIKTLFRRYADWLESDLGITPKTHGIDAEIIELPVPCTPRDGALIGAKTRDGSYVGCIALRRLDEQPCELKRLSCCPRCVGMVLAKRSSSL